MLARIVVSIIRFCVAHARLVVALGVVLGVVCSLFAASRFRLNSDIDALLPSNVAWRVRQLAFEKTFSNMDLLDVVVKAPTPELTAGATRELTEALESDEARIQSAVDAGQTEFFTRNALLFMPIDALKRATDGLEQGEPLLQDIASDRSLRGLIAGLEDALLGLQTRQLKLDQFARPLNAASDALDQLFRDKPAFFSWRALMEDKPSPNELFGFVQARPVLDFQALQPGLKAEDAVRRIAAPIAAKYDATVRMTGPVAINDEQFGTIKENAIRNTVATVAIVLLILWLALRSFRLIAALVVNLLIGLAATAAAGTLLAPAFNIISIYFAVLFVGIGVDFAIQYSVRYRDERHRLGDLVRSLQSAGNRVALPLALASLATAAGFFSFLPTNYRGLSELGMIAGVGMLIAFATSVTLLPALIVLLNPPGEPEPLGYRSLAPLDECLARRRRPIILATALAVACASPALLFLKFDSNPIHLQSPNSEAISTYLELQRQPLMGVDAAQALAPSLAQADAMAARLMKLPEVAGAITLSSFIPADQPQKIALIRATDAKLAEVFDPKSRVAPPTDAENVEALKEGAQRLLDAADDQTGPGAEAAKRLSAQLTKLADAPPEVRAKATHAFIWPLDADLAALQASLRAEPITLETLPRQLAGEWIAPSGEARISIAPNADPEDTPAMRRFARAVLAVDPNATEGPIVMLKAGDMIFDAFIEAGGWALLSIAAILLIALRRVGDVALTLIPLALAGVVTMEIMAIVGMPFNFANIIALPLLLGVGVAFKIYYIMAWREGTTHLLQTPLTRAVIFSALTTATAFGSLWLSSNPGAASMGELLALSLVCTLAAAVLFQPILMGKPRSPSPP